MTTLVTTFKGFFSLGGDRGDQTTFHAHEEQVGNHRLEKGMVVERKTRFWNHATSFRKAHSTIFKQDAKDELAETSTTSSRKPDKFTAGQNWVSLPLIDTSPARVDESSRSLNSDAPPIFEIGKQYPVIDGELDFVCAQGDMEDAERKWKKVRACVSVSLSCVCGIIDRGRSSCEIPMSSCSSANRKKPRH